MQSRRNGAENSESSKRTVTSRRVTIEVDAVDAAVIGATLRMLAAINRSPDIDVAARMQRVGDALTTSGVTAQVLDLVEAAS
jgi:hypothetical protein